MAILHPLASPEVHPEEPGAGEEPNDRAARSADRVWERNDYYRDSWRKLWTAFIVVSLALLVSLGLNVVLLATQKDPLPIAVDPTGRVFAVTPLTEDTLDGDGIRQWAARTVPLLYAIDFRNYREQMAQLEPYFTDAGYKGYLEAVNRYRLVDTIKANNYIAGAAPRAAPQVIGTGMMEGRKFWKVRAPLVVTYDNGSTPMTQNLMVTAYIVRVPETRNPFGLSIHSFAAARG